MVCLAALSLKQPSADLGPQTLQALLIKSGIFQVFAVSVVGWMVSFQPANACIIVSYCVSLSTYLYVYIYIHNDTTIHIYVHIYPVYMCKHTKVKKHAVLKNVGTQAT